jgi:hypothetical protein
MTEWVRLREARKREVALKNQVDRPYLIRLQTLSKLRDKASRQARKSMWKYEPGDWDAWRVQAEIAMGEILGELHPLMEMAAESPCLPLHSRPQARSWEANNKAID